MNNQNTEMNAINNMSNKQSNGSKRQHSIMSDGYKQNLGSMENQGAHHLGSQSNNLNSQYGDMNSQIGLNTNSIHNQKNDMYIQPKETNNQFNLNNKYTNPNNQSTRLNNQNISLQNQHTNAINQPTGLNNQYTNVNSQPNDMTAHPIYNQYTALGREGNSLDGHQPHLHDKFTGLVHHSDGVNNRSLNMDRNIAGATVEDINNATHQQRDLPSHDQALMNNHQCPEYHSLNKMFKKNSSQLPGNDITKSNYNQDESCVTKKTPVSYPNSSNNNTSLSTNQNEYTKNGNNIPSISSTPSEYGSSDENISPRSVENHQLPIADKNAFIQSEDTKKHWQHNMSPVDRAKELAAEMDPIIHERKNSKNKSLKIGETKEYKLA